MSDFWTRRKQGVAREAVRQHAAEAEAAAAEDRAALEALPDAEALERLDLPDPDTLGPGDDFARFLAREVPERLRRRALRALWRSNPVLANVDGLVDHGEDYTDAATVPALLNTTYQVGKGLAAHVRRLSEALDEVAGDAPAAVPASVRPPAAPVAPESVVAASDGVSSGIASGAPANGPDGLDDTASADVDVIVTESPHSTGTSDAAAPRARMRFSFEDEETAA